MAKRKNPYEMWKMNLTYRGSNRPAKRIEKKWWRRLQKETRKSNLIKISTSKKPRTYGEYFDLLDLKNTTRRLRKLTNLEKK